METLNIEALSQEELKEEYYKLRWKYHELNRERLEICKERDEIIRNILFRATNKNIRNVIYKWNKRRIWDWDFDYTLD